MSSGPSSSHHTPRDAKVMASILKDVGVEDYEPRVINQMMEFAYRYVADILDDARVYSEYASKKSVDVDDVRLSVQMKVENTLTNPPSREMMAELAQEKNAIPLPAMKQQYGLRLPPDRYCTLQPNFRLKTATAVGPGATAGRPVSMSSMPPGVRMVQQQQRPKQLPSPKLGKPTPVSSAPMATPTSIGAVAAAKPATSSSVAKPLFRLVAGSLPSAAPSRPITGTSEVTATTSGGGVKRKMETLDEDYDQN